MDSVIKAILDDNWVELKDHIQDRTNTIIKDKINEKKVEFLADINKISKEKMQEILDVK